MQASADLLKGNVMKIGFVLCCFLVLLANVAGAADRWHLEFSQVKMDRVLVKSGDTSTTYWYMIYKVKNPMEDEHQLNLFIRAHSDVGKRSYFEMYYPRAQKAIEAKEGRSFKNLRDMRNKIGAGETLEGVAIFKSVHEGTNNLKIRVSGLRDRVVHLGGKVFVEDWVLDLYFYKKGDEYYPQFDPIVFKKAKLVLLSRKEKQYR